MGKVVGVIYPIPLKFVDRLFSEQRNVFVKYLAHPTRVRIAQRNRILFYASHGQKELVGEASITSIEFLTPTEALERYDGKVFLNKAELMQYTSGRSPSKKLLVMVLSQPRKYAKAVKYWKPITMAGEYITEEVYKKLKELGKKKGR